MPACPRTIQGLDAIFGTGNCCGVQVKEVRHLGRHQEGWTCAHHRDNVHGRDFCTRGPRVYYNFLGGDELLLNLEPEERMIRLRVVYAVLHWRDAPHGGRRSVTGWRLIVADACKTLGIPDSPEAHQGLLASWDRLRKMLGQETNETSREPWEHLVVLAFDQLSGALLLLNTVVVAAQALKQAAKALEDAAKALEDAAAARKDAAEARKQADAAFKITQQQLDIVEEAQWGQQQQIKGLQERLQKAEEARLAAEEAARVAAEAKAAEKAAQPASSRSALGDVTNEQQSANMEAHLAAKAKAAEEAAKEKARLAAEAKAAEEKAAEEAARAAAEAKAAEKKAAEEEEARLAVEAKAAEKTAQQAQLAQQAQPAVVGPRHCHRLLRLFRLLRPAQYCVILLLFSIYLVCASSHSSRERITTESFFQVASPIFLQSHPIPSHLILSRLITSNPTPPDPTRSHATPCNPVRSRAISSYSNSSPPYLIPFHPTPSCPV